jgi:folate-binding protein YgfZ
VSDNRLINHTDEALDTLHKDAGFYLAKQHGLLVISGKDTASFLQSQLSNDINELKPGLGQFSCLLDRKAQVQAYFHLYRAHQSDSQVFYVLAERSQLTSLIKDLEQYRFAAQVEFKDLSDDGYFIAIEGPRAAKIFGALSPLAYLNNIIGVDTCDTAYSDYDAKIFRHSTTGENGYFFWLSPKDIPGFSVVFENVCKDLSFAKLIDQTILISRLETGGAQFDIDFDKNNLLPETNLLDKTVSYTKGCFIGQEVLARVKSHGMPAKAIIGLFIDFQSTVDTALPLNSAIIIDGEEIGQIKSNAYSPTLRKFIALAMLKRDYRVPGKIFDAVIAEQKVTGMVAITPFIRPQTNIVLARKLYEESVQKFVQTAEGTEPTEAIKLLQEVLILDSNLEDAYEALAVILSKNNELNAAINIMKILAKLNTASVMAHSNLSQFYVQQNLKELAEEEKAIALSIRMRLAAAQFNNEKTQEAEKEKGELLRRKEMFEQVLAIDDQDFFANAGFGECLVAEKEFVKAIPYLKKAIEIKPIHLQAYLDLSKAYKETGANDTAKEIISEGIAIATKRGDTALITKLQDQLKGFI